MTDAEIDDLEYGAIKAAAHRSVDAFLVIHRRR
jgi:hypothetical protein